MTSTPVAAGTAALTVEPRIPLLDEVLRERFERLPDRVVADLCRHEHLTDSMAEMVETLTGIAPRLMPESGNNGITHLVWCVDGAYDRVGGRQADRPGRIGEVIVTDRFDRWNRTPRRQFAFVSRRQLQATRVEMLREHLGRAMVTGTTIDAAIRQPWRPLLVHAMSLRVAYALWWDARIREGHSVASATTLLALVAQPDALRRFTMTGEGPRLYGPYGVRPPH